MRAQEVGVTTSLPAENVELPEYLIRQINDIVPGKPATDIRNPGFTARAFGKIASLGARLSIWLDASIYSMLTWWGDGRVVFAQLLFHVATVWAVAWFTRSFAAVSALVVLAFAASLVIQFMLYAFEYSLMGKKERALASFQDEVVNDVHQQLEGGRRGEVLYKKGTYRITALHNPPRMLMMAFFWPLATFFVVVECVAHALLVARDYALGNRYGSFVLLPSDWVEFYKEVPIQEYTGFVPESLRRRLDQVAKEHTGQTFVLVPFGLMPDHMPGIDSLSDGRVAWTARLENLQRPQGDPVLAVRLEDATKYGRMLVVGHWLTLATLQKLNLLFRNFSLDVQPL